jgi:sucrose-6-phosphate hydrolase SacC (GH32 family)
MADSQSKLDESSVQASGSEGSSSHIPTFMMLLAFVFAAVAAAASNSSTPTATPIFDSGVPTNAPVPGNYTGALRPQIHFSPPQKFMNDPNGCHRDSNGTYHLYYQCKSGKT